MPPKLKSKAKATPLDEIDKQDDYISLSIVKQLMAQKRVLLNLWWNR